MRLQATRRFCGILCASCLWLAGQGLTTSATRADWEEINFAFNSSVLSDGYPTLLRLADLLVRNPGYSAKLYGHTDSLGPDSVNDPLSKARAEMVKAFLASHGARPAQIQTIGRGELEPAASNRTPEGRFMNRRVRTVVLDEKGREVSAIPLGAGLRPVRTDQPVEPPPVRQVQQTTRSLEAGPRTCFAVQLGAFRERVNAERLKESLQRSSFRVELSPWGANPLLWKVLVGCEATRDAAVGVAGRLAGNSDKPVIVRVSDPAKR
mgnify:CR=1 FL=1